MASILVLNGPNLNLLGKREPGVYGAEDLNAIHQRLLKQAEHAGHTLRCEQSNAEHELIDLIHAGLSQDDSGVAQDWIIFNPAAFTHTSIALRDALCSRTQVLAPVCLDLRCVTSRHKKPALVEAG